MILRVPDTLTVSNSEKYIVSIRLWSGGLSFAGYIPSEKDSFFYGETKLDQTKSYFHALKDIFFTHAFFAYSYKKNYVIFVNSQYTLVPENIFVENQKEQLMAFTFSSSAEGEILQDSLNGFDAKMLYGIHPEVYEFCFRSLINPHFIHSMTPILVQWRKQNLMSYPKQLYVCLHEKTMDAACYDKGALQFTNSFNVEDAADIIYFVLYIWKQMGMDQLKDQLFISTNQAMYRELKDVLQEYVLLMEPITLQLFNNVEVPLDITSLFQCE